MRITISTPVKQSRRPVAQGFNEELFKKLSPPFPPVKLLRFDGSSKGDTVALELNFIFFKQVWESHITESGETEREWYFVDEGVKLPFFLRYWQHRHRVVQTGTHATIIDDITYETPFLLTDYLMYPVMWLQFVYRQPVYRRVFG
jgi:ligand-binding SRPBCC domain-containing protein